MKNIKSEIDIMLRLSAKNIGQMIASESFEFWSRKDFRLYIDFDSLSQTEQDRIFNELEVSTLGLFTLQLDQAISHAPEERILVLETLRNGLPTGFLQLLSDSGVEGRYVKQWKTLIDMRIKEYREDFQIGLKESESMREFEGDHNFRVTWAVTETITIDCLNHIRKGKVEQNDPLWKLLRKWFITLHARLTPITDSIQTQN